MKYIILTILLSFTLHAQSSETVTLAKNLNLYAGSKAVIQWERVFSSSRHLTRYKLDSLSQKQRDDLKKYLINHAADSKQPIVPGL